MDRKRPQISKSLLAMASSKATLSLSATVRTLIFFKLLMPTRVVQEALFTTRELATSPGNYNVSNPGCPGGGNAHCLSKVYGADATVFNVQQIAYSIATGSEGEPALFRNGDEYLDGIEDFQVLYGEDTDGFGTAGSGIANYYVPASQVVDMNNVVSIRFAVVTRSQDDNLTGGALQSYEVLGEAKKAQDQRIRQTYMSTVTIRNRL